MPTSDVMAKPPAPEATPLPPRDLTRPAPPAYRAFLSYSHADARWADWLHKALETYRLPPALVGKDVGHGAIPARLAPVFRDRHELAAASDLSAEITEALDEARSLVVLCSPAAAQSRWVDLEVATFKRRHPDRPVLAAIVAGAPGACDKPGEESEECFPPALRRKFSKAGRVTSKRAEPIAADLREGGDGKRMGLLKLVAGILDVSLDALARREAQRRQRRLTWLAAASFAGMATTSGLAIAAVDARDAAHDQRDRAEGLIEYMLTDLRAKLEPVGRLDVLDSVGTRTLAYYGEQDREGLSDTALGHRARALHLIGQVAQLRGELDEALSRFREAERSTAEALARAPADQQRIFDHAQSVFWVGSIARQRRQTREAEAKWREYKALASRLIALDPRNPKWRLEGVYADAALGALLQEDRQFQRALPIFESSLRNAQVLFANNPENAEYRAQFLNALAWTADALETRGRLGDAARARARQLELIARLDPNGNDAMLSLQTLVAQIALSRLALWRGDLDGALVFAQLANASAQELRSTEPDNVEWAENASYAALRLAEAQDARGDPQAAAMATEHACAIAEQLVAREPSVSTWRSRALVPCMIQRTRILAKQGGTASALAFAERALRTARGGDPDNLEARRVLAAAHELMADMADASGRERQAVEQRTAALASLASLGELSPVDLARRAIILQRLGQRQQAQPIVDALRTIGYRHPHYLETINLA